MDFAMLPPEINSARMYGGPGSGPMLAAATAWNGLAAELESAASSYQSVISGLTGGPWLGPSSMSMAAAAAPYVEWMTTTAAQAAQTATQSQAAAAAFEAAFAATVPPPVIAANRAELMMLVATNFFGQNTSAIAANQAEYAEMWAQDAAAMYGYAGSAATATQVTPWAPPPPTTSPGGLAGQAAAVSQATGTWAATNTQTVLSQLTSAVPAALQSLASPISSTSVPSGLLSSLIGPGSQFQTFFGPINSYFAPIGAGIGSAGVAVGSGSWNSAHAAATEIINTQGQLVDTQGQISGMQGQISGMQGQILGRLNQLGTVPAAGPVVSAGLGRAGSIGGVSVPQGWAAAAPAIRTVAAALPASSLGAAPEIWAASPGSLFSEMALASLAGRAIGGTASMGGRAGSKKLGDSTDYRAGIAATFGGVVARTNMGYPVRDCTETDHGDGQLLEQVAKRYPGIFALLDALGSPNGRSTEPSLAKFEREILGFVRRFTAAD